MAISDEEAVDSIRKLLLWIGHQGDEVISNTPVQWSSLVIRRCSLVMKSLYQMFLTEAAMSLAVMME